MSREAVAPVRPRPLPEDPPALAEVYAYPPGRGWLRANMIASIDGAAWWDGRTEAMGNDADRRLFQLLRGLADAVIVGAGTVRGEGYGPVRPGPGWAELRAGRSAVPPLAVVSRSMSLDLDAPIFTAAAEPTILLTTETAPADRRAAARRRAQVIVCGEDAVDFTVATKALRELGHTRLLCEGGPTVLAQVTRQGLLDELCLTVSPLILSGEAPRILDGPTRPTAARMRLAGVLAEDDYLYLRYVHAAANGDGDGNGSTGTS